MEDAIRKSAVCPLCDAPKYGTRLTCHKCGGRCELCGRKVEKGRAMCDDCIAESMGYKRVRREPVRGGGEYADASLVTD